MPNNNPIQPTHRTFNLDGVTGSVPFENADKFLKDNPTAKEVVAFDLDGQRGYVPVENAYKFMLDNQTAKPVYYDLTGKKPVAKPSDISTFAPKRTNLVTPIKPEEVPNIPNKQQQQQAEQQAQQAFDAGFSVKTEPKAKQQQTVTQPQQVVPSENIYIGVKTPNGGIIAVDQENETPYFETKNGQRTYFNNIKEVQEFAPAGLTDFFTEQYINLKDKQQAQKETEYFRGQITPTVEDGEGYTPDVETQKALTEQKKQRDTEHFIEQASEKYNLFKGYPYQNLARYAPELNESIQYYSQYAPDKDVMSLSDQDISEIQKRDAIAGRPIIRSPKLLQDYADISRRRVNEDIKNNEASIDEKINALDQKEKEWRKSNAEKYKSASGYSDIGKSINDISPYDMEKFQLINLKSIMNKVKNSAEETDPTFWGEVGRSISNVDWSNIILAGIPQLADDTYMAQLMIKENKKPETLNENEKQMLKYYRAYQDVQSVTSDSSIETITKIIAESLPLMFSMVGTGGFTSAVGKGVVKGLLEKGVKKGISKAVGFGAEVGLQAALTPYTYDYTAQKIIEDPDISNKELLWKTLVNGLATVGVEKSGGLIDPVISRFNPISISKQLKGGSKRMFEAVSNLQKVSGLNSFSSEMIEEVLQVPFTYITDGASAFDGFSADNLANTVSAIALMTMIPAGAKGTIIGTSYVLDKNKARKQYLKSEVELPASIKNEVIGYMNAKTPQEQQEASKPLNSVLVRLNNPEDRKKVVDYMVNKTTYDYLRFGQEGAEKLQVENQAKNQALTFINNNKAIDSNELIYATDNKTGNNLFVRTLANQDDADLSTVVVVDTVTGEKKQVKLSDITITERMPTTDFYNQIVDYRINEYATKKEAELSAEDAEDAQLSASGTVYDIGDEVYIDGRKARIQGETDGQGNYPVVFDTEDGLGESAVVPARTISTTAPAPVNAIPADLPAQEISSKPASQADVQNLPADLPASPAGENRPQPKYPTTKTGEVDIDALDDNQLFQYNAETNGTEQAIADYTDEIASIGEDITKLNTKLSKSPTKEKVKIRKQITDLNARKSNLQSIINQNIPQNAVKEGNIEQNNQPERGGVAEPQQGEQTNRIDQETNVPVAEAETGGGDSAEQGREVKEEVKPKSVFTSNLRTQQRNVIDGLQQRAINALPTIVVNNKEELLEELAKNPLIGEAFIKDTKKKKDGAIAGLNTNNAVYIVLNGNKTLVDVIDTWMHEQVGHAGIFSLFPKKEEQEKLFTRIFDDIGAVEIKKIVGLQYEAEFKDKTEAEQKVMWAMEYVARIAEKLDANEALTPSEQSTWDKIISYINALLNAITNNKVKWSEERVMDLAMVSAKKLAMELPKGKTKSGLSAVNIGGELQIIDSNGNIVQTSKPTKAKYIKDYLENEDWSQGDMSYTKEGEAYSENQNQFIADNSENAEEVALALLDEQSPNNYVKKETPTLSDLKNKFYELTGAQPTPTNIKAVLSKYNERQANEVNTTDDTRDDYMPFNLVKQDPKLVVVHNIKPSGVLNVDKIGGLPMPSLAIVDVNTGFTGYGDITLIADKDLIDPKKDKNAKVFGADVYSPRYPSITYDIPAKGSRLLDSKINSIDNRDLESYVSNQLKNKIQGRGIDDLLNSTASKVLFLKDNGYDFDYIKNEVGTSEKVMDEFIKKGLDKIATYDITDNDKIKKQLTDLYLKQNIADKKIIREEFIKEDGFLNENLMRNFLNDVQRDIRIKDKVNESGTAYSAERYVRDNNLQAEYEKYINDLYDAMGVEEKIFKGYTPSGTRKYVPHNIDNVIKEMKSAGLRAGESFSYGGLGDLRATFTPQFKSIKDIQNNKGLLQDNIDKAKDELEKEMDELQDKLVPFFKYDRLDGSTMTEELVVLANRGYSESFNRLDTETLNAVREFADKLRSMPTTYFEAKITRAVDLGEFKTALVPEDTSDKVKEVLERKGLKVSTYINEEDRQSKLKSESLEQNIQFNIIGEQGATALDKAEEATTRLDNLGIAKEMEVGGKTPQEIRLATGWEKGVDGKWRYEILDINTTKKFNDLDIGTEISLSQAIDSKQLFNAYPELKKVRVEIIDTRENAGSYDDKAKKIEISTYTPSLNGDEYSEEGINNGFKSTLIHEIQHAIQDIEGFAKGGNLQTPYEDLESQRISLIRRRNVLMKENGFTKNPEYVRLNDEIKNIIDKLWEYENPNSTKSFDEYKRLAGETEARNAQTRMNYTSEERLNKLLSETADVAPQDQIVIMDALGAMNLEVSPTNLEQIKQQAITDGTFMKAPNGQPTNLNERQWLQTRTPEFKAWFGDFIHDPENASQVVDENGDPLVVYHGSEDDFNIFDTSGDIEKGVKLDKPDAYIKNKGAYFANTKDYADLYGFYAYDGGITRPFFLDIKTPDNKYKGDKKNILPDDFLKIKGDGLIFDTEEGIEYVAFSPTQIKSATANVGTFSPSDANIMFNLTKEEVNPDSESEKREFIRSDEYKRLSKDEKKRVDYLSTINIIETNEIEIDDSYDESDVEHERTIAYKPVYRTELNYAENSDPLYEYFNDIYTSVYDLHDNQMSEDMDKYFEPYKQLRLMFKKIEINSDGSIFDDNGDVYSLDEIDNLNPKFIEAIDDLSDKYSYSDEIATESFDSRENSAKDLEYEVYSNISSDIIKSYNIYGQNINVLVPEYGKYRTISIEDDNGNQITTILLRISDHSYNPSNNIGVDNFISVEIANKNETENKFHGINSLKFNGEDNYDDVIESVNERIKEIIYEELPDISEQTVNPAITALTPEQKSSYKEESTKLDSELEAKQAELEQAKEVFGKTEQLPNTLQEKRKSVVSVFTQPKVEEVKQAKINDIQDGIAELNKQKDALELKVNTQAWKNVDDGVDALFSITKSPETATEKQKQKAEELLTRLQEDVDMMRGRRDKFIYDFQNINLPVKQMQDLIENLTGKKIGVNMDVFSALNRFTSSVSGSVEMYAMKVFKPVIEKTAYFEKEYGIPVDNTKDYMLAKHSLERHNWRPEPFTEKDFMVAISDKVIKEKKNDNGDVVGYVFNGKTYETKDELFKGVDDSKTVTALSEEADAEWNVEKVTNIINEFESKVSKEDLADFWNKINEATETNIKALKDSGRISVDEYNFYKDRWKYYVPLRGWELTDDLQNKIDMYNSVNYAGEPIRTTYVDATKRAKGRTSKPDDPLPYIQNLAYSSYITAEKNKVVQKLLNLVRTYPQLTELFEIAKTNFIKKGDVWIETKEVPEDVDELIKKGEYIRHRKDVREFIKYVPDPNAGMVEVYDNGERYLINVKQIDVAKSINMEASVKLPKFISNTLGWTSRNISANFTARNPAFVLKNSMRDVQYAILTGAIEHDWRIGSGDVSKNLPSSAQAISRYLRGKANPEMVDELQRQYDNARTKSDKKHIGEKLDKAKDDVLMVKFMSYGAKTGFIHVESLDQVKKRINRDLKAINAGKVKKASLNTITAFSRLLKYGSDVSENMARFSVFKSAMEKGYSFEEASNMAKGCTTNFNYKGRLTPIFGTLYSFFNAAIQGGANFASLMWRNKKRGAFSMLMFMVAGAVWQEIARCLAGDDDRGNNKYDLINDFTKENNIVLPLGEVPIIIPLPPGFRLFWGMGHSVSDMMYGKKKVLDGTLNIFDQFTNAFSPINAKVADFSELNNPTKSNASKLLSILRPVTPTVGIPFIDLLGNENFFGSKIYKERSPFKIGTPDSELGMKNVNPNVAKFSKGLNKLFGGDEYTSSGFFTDINPSKIEYLGEYYGGGTLKFWNNVYKTASLIWDKEIEYKPSNIPILGSFTSSLKAKDYTKDYIDLSKQIELESERYKAYKNDENYSDKAKELESKYGTIHTGRGKKRTENLKPMYELKQMEKKLKELYEDIDKSKSETEVASIKKQIEQLRYEFVNKYNKIYKTK